MIEAITPDIFESIPGVHALFTLSNRDNFHNSDGIEGLNFGINTAENASTIEKNRLILAESINVSPKSFVIADQVHGDRVEVVQEPGLYRKTDGLITMDRNLILTIQAADCAAVLVADVKNKIIGIFHAGWRGAVKNIVSKGVEKMRSLSKKEPHFMAYIGPCISQKNFEVGPEVAEQFPSEFVDNESYNKPHINLKDYLKNELVVAGVNKDHIEVSDKCTMDDLQFYSYRRERDKAGRMLACLYMNGNKELICE